MKTVFSVIGTLLFAILALPLLLPLAVGCLVMRILRVLCLPRITDFCVTLIMLPLVALAGLASVVFQGGILGAFGGTSIADVPPILDREIGKVGLFLQSFTLNLFNQLILDVPERLRKAFERD